MNGEPLEEYTLGLKKIPLSSGAQHIFSKVARQSDLKFSLFWPTHSFSYMIPISRHFEIEITLIIES